MSEGLEEGKGVAGKLEEWNMRLADSPGTKNLLVGSREHRKVPGAGGETMCLTLLTTKNMQQLE